MSTNQTRTNLTGWTRDTQTVGSGRAIKPGKAVTTFALIVATTGNGSARSVVEAGTECACVVGQGAVLTHPPGSAVTRVTSTIDRKCTISAGAIVGAGLTATIADLLHGRKKQKNFFNFH